MDESLTIILNERLENAFNLTFDLYNSMEENNLANKIHDLPSNTIGQQVWCIIGARESYTNAIKNSKWIGFNCSLKNSNNKSDIIQLLESTNGSIFEYLEANTISVVQIKFIFALLEHEIQHHGQLIRYMYANKIQFPQSWTDRYTV